MATTHNSPRIRTLALASLGGALEYYDFVVFVFLTPVIARLFFPADMKDWLRETETFGIFAAGYIVRPLGGIVMAHFGDTRGRKRMFTFSVMLMAIATFVIALLPTYSSIGIAAPLLLLLMRMLQGTALGAEAPGGWVFGAEHAKPGHVGLAVGLLTGGLSLGILLGSIVATALTFTHSPAQISSGMWRLPFFIGGVFGLTAMFLRRWLDETPVFEQMRERAKLCRELPLRKVLRSHRSAVVTSMIGTCALIAMILVVILMTPALLQHLFGLPATLTQAANLAGAAGLCVGNVTVGAACDRFGTRRVAVVMYALLIAATFGLYLSAAHASVLLVPMYLLAGFGAGASVIAPTLMVAAFPPDVRFTGVSFSYNVATAVMGGITPMLVSSLAHWNRFAPAYYVAVLSVVGLAAALWSPEDAMRSVALADEVAA
jgi:MFS transporter, MHS family, proline/betaine transporter